MTLPQSVEYMYSNELSNGKLPNIKTSESYGANDLLKRGEAAAFSKTLSNFEFTYFRETKSKATGSDIIGIINISLIIDKDATILSPAKIKVSQAADIEVPEWVQVYIQGQKWVNKVIGYGRTVTFPTSTLSFVPLLELYFT